MASHRILRINELLREEVGKILTEELDRAPGDFVTISYVQASPDLQHAKVYITIFPEKSVKEIEARLKACIYHIQQILNMKLKMRPVPKLEWVIERDPEKTQRIDEIFDKIDRE